MVAEIAHNHFSGDVTFDVGDIVNLYSEHRSYASHRALMIQAVGMLSGH